MERFTFKMPTRFVFGCDTAGEAGRLVAHYGGTKALMLYGDGAVRRSGLLKQVRESLERSLLDFVELGGAHHTPQAGVVREGISLVRDEHVDFVVALGDAAVANAAKAIAAGACYWGDVWDFYGGDHVPDTALPVGCISTALDSGVTASCESMLLDGDGRTFETFSREIVPAFSILDPTLTLNEPVDCGKEDIERVREVLSKVDDDGSGVADAPLAGHLMSAVAGVVEERIARLEADPANVDARGDLMWASVIAASGFISAGSNGFRDR